MNVRNIILYLVSACLVAVGVSSCILNEKITTIEEDRSIWYNTAPVKIRPQTKATEAFPTTSTFGSYAFMVPEGKTFDANKADDDVVTFIDNQEISYQTDRWKGATTYYWPQTGSLTFISYAPYELSERSSEFTFKCEKSSGISITGFSLANTVGYSEPKDDILIADIAEDLSGNTYTYYYSGVPTLFQHKLSKVAIMASINNDLGTDESVVINSISLQNIYTKGNYSQTGGWSSQSELKNYETGMLNQSLTSLAPVEVFSETLMIPQTTTLSDRGTGNDPKLIVSYTVTGETKTAELKLYSGPSSLAAWEEGKAVTYYISISTKEEYIEFSRTYDAWRDAGDSGINMGI